MKVGSWHHCHSLGAACSGQIGVWLDEHCYHFAKMSKLYRGRCLTSTGVVQRRQRGGWVAGVIGIARLLQPLGGGRLAEDGGAHALLLQLLRRQ